MDDAEVERTVAAALQAGMITLTKSARIERMAQNAAISEIFRSDEDMLAIGGISRSDDRLVNPGHRPRIRQMKG